MVEEVSESGERVMVGAASGQSGWNEIQSAYTETASVL